MPLTPEERAQAVKELYAPQPRPATEPVLPPMTPEVYEAMQRVAAERERQRAEAAARARQDEERKWIEEYERRRRLIKGNTLPGMFDKFMKESK